MSGGGKAPPAPDLSGNISKANQTFDTATSNASQTMNTAQAYNQNAQNTLNNVTGANTALGQQVGQTATNNLNTYNQTFSPLQAQQAQQAKDYTSDQNVQQLQGMAVADQNASLQSSLANQRAALASEGVDPASVHGSALTQQAQVQGAAANANAANQSYLNTQNTGRQLVQQANQLGLQVGAAGTQGGQAAAGINSQNVANTNQTNSNAVNNLTAANTYLGTGINANNSGVNAAQGQFQDQMQSYQAQQAANASGLQSLGSIAGAAAMFAMEKGGVVPEGYSGGGLVPKSAPVAQFSGGGVLPRQLPNNYDMGGQVGADPSSSWMGNVAQNNPDVQAVGGAIPQIHAPAQGPNMAQYQAAQGVGGFGAALGQGLKMSGMMQEGGHVSSQGALPQSPIPGSTDTKPAWLTPGEFVIPKDVAAWKGHEHWYKEMDKARAAMHQAHGLPPPMPSAMTTRGH